MRRCLLSVACLVLLAACEREVTQYTHPKAESAIVVELAFVPAGHGSGVGITTGGQLAVSAVDIPARYAIVFQCEHGTFAIQGAQHVPLWKRLHKGQRVAVQYREVQRCTQRDGEILQETCRTVDMDFLAATPAGVK